MKMRICTCKGEPTEVFVLDQEEREFFNNNPNDFLDCINQNLKMEREQSAEYQKMLDFDEIVDENEKLKEEIERLKK